MSSSSLGSCIWNCEVWNWYCCHVGDEARTYYEVYYSSSHGGYYCHLRASRGCADCQWSSRRLHIVQVSL